MGISHGDLPNAKESLGKTSKLVWSGLRVIVSAIAIPIVVVVATSFYVNTHLLKPNLTAQYAWGDVIVLPVEGHPNDYLVVLVDLRGLHGTWDSHLKAPVFSGEFASAKMLSFKSSKDYVIHRPSGTTRIMTIALTNEGHVTANHIKLGLSCSEGASNATIIPSANIKTAQQTVAGSGINPAFLSVEIDRMGARERGLLTVKCDLETATANPERKYPFVTIHRNSLTVPVLYINSDEGSGTVLSGTSWSEGAKWQQANFPASTVGYWVSRITVKLGVVPVVSDLKYTAIEAEMVDESGKKVEIGSLKINHDSP